VISFKEALIWTCVWVGLALAFYLFLIHYGHLIHGIDNMDKLKEIVSKHHHPEKILLAGSFEASLSKYNFNLGLEYITGYLIEYALSIDNVFVMILIFMSFGVEQKYYKRVLFWGILGAIVMRFVFIFLSSILIHKFYWILYVFGVFLIYAGIQMFLSRNRKEQIDPGKHPVVRFASKYFALYPEINDERFWLRIDGKLFITPLMLVLLVIEFSDVLFAVDSVPAIFSVTQDPYLVFFSNIFAIIGLRSLFFLIINVMNRFRYLKHGLSVLLTFIGVKMVFHEWLEHIGFSTIHSLLVVLLIICTSIFLSLISSLKDANEKK
jgi:tellurite resistance protein TerC